MPFNDSIYKIKVNYFDGLYMGALFQIINEKFSSKMQFYILFLLLFYVILSVCCSVRSCNQQSGWHKIVICEHI